MPTEPVTDPDRIAYYPGCSLHGTSREFDASVRAALGRLGVTLEEPEGWVCCGTTAAHCSDPVLAAALPLKNLALIEESGHSYATAPCPLCFSRLRSAARDARRDPDLRRRVAARVPELAEDGNGAGSNGRGEGPEAYVPAATRVDHLLATVTERIGYERVADAVVRPLSGLKVACYYGCVITRPPDLTEVEDYEYPRNMDRLVETLGGEAVDWSCKTDCCGASLGITQLPIALRMTQRILQNAKAAGADAVVVACPFCHVNLDSRQRQIEEDLGQSLGLPVFYFTQLMGLAFGLEPGDLGLGTHFVDPRALLGQKGWGRRAQIAGRRA